MWLIECFFLLVEWDEPQEKDDDKFFPQDDSSCCFLQMHVFLSLLFNHAKKKTKNCNYGQSTLFRYDNHGS